MTTVDEAREALLAFVVSSPDKAERLRKLLDALIAAVRAEEREIVTLEFWGPDDNPMTRAETAQELAALLAEGRTAKPSGDTMYDDGWLAALNFIERRAALTRREPLDVERLGEAAENINRRVLVLGGHVEQAAYGEMIAAECARLEAADKSTT